ncbi:MAG: response regulator [Fulvivirga sp.]|uniref:LytR/AlgR family response regulator transcription factor n=1 Tax=Fulvivirga sp. TaxID=1931237 RepID=UPI0032ED76B4
MNKIKILIVEDEFIIGEDLSDMLDELGYQVVDLVGNFNNAIDSIQKHSPDLILLDIKIKGVKDGIDLAGVIKEQFDLPFIFISSHSDSETVKRAADVNPYGYLVKPFEKSDVGVAIEIGLSNYAKQNDKVKDEFILNNCLFVKYNNVSVKVPLTELLYVKAEGNYSIIKTITKSYTLRSTLKDIQEKLPDKLFFRSHKSFIINLDHISAINSESVFINDEKLPIGREQMHQLQEKINKL